MLIYSDSDCCRRTRCRCTPETWEAETVGTQNDCSVCNILRPEVTPTPNASTLNVFRRVETVETLKQHFILVPSHVREVYLYHFLCNPPESTLHLRRAPPEPTKRFDKQRGGQHKASKKSKSQKKSTDEDEVPEQPPPTIIFCTRPRTAAYLTHLLQTLRIRTTSLHSRLTQRERLSSLSLFRASVVPVLISTDVGARGLDIEDVAIVINWDIPSEPEEYTHRVGRTARAGRGGVAVSFVTERDEERILKVEERIGESPFGHPRIAIGAPPRWFGTTHSPKTFLASISWFIDFWRRSLTPHSDV